MASILSRNKNLDMPKKTMSDHAEDALYREVWEDVNNEKTMAFIKRYSRPLAAAAMIILIVAAGFQVWRMVARDNRIASAEMYETAIMGADSTALVGMAKNNSGATADLAMFQSYLIGGDVSNLEALAENGATRDFRDLAKLHLAAHKGDTMTGAEFENFLGDLNTKKSPYYYSSRLLIAQKYLADGNADLANKFLDQIISDKDAPSIISANAEALR